MGVDAVTPAISVSFVTDYEDEVEYTYERIAELAREMPSRCKKP